MLRSLDGDYSTPNCICITCKHYIGHKNNVCICKAFPNGIPLEIWNLKVDHFKPYKGDNGLQFEENEIEIDESAELIEDIDFELAQHNKTAFYTKLNEHSN